MTYEENIKAILQCWFTGFKEEIIEGATNRILEVTEQNQRRESEGINEDTHRNIK